MRRGRRKSGRIRRKATPPPITTITRMEGRAKYRPDYSAVFILCKTCGKIQIGTYLSELTCLFKILCINIVPGNYNS